MTEYPSSHLKEFMSLDSHIGVDEDILWHKASTVIAEIWTCQGEQKTGHPSFILST